MDVMRAAAEKERAGTNVIHMEVGQPGTPAPAAALERVRCALGRDTLGYSLALGMPELRARIARAYRDWYGVEVPAGRVLVTPYLEIAGPDSGDPGDGRGVPVDADGRAD